MLALLRLFGLLLVALTVVYVCLWAYLRAGQRARLEAEWRDTQPPLPLYRHVAVGLDSSAPRLRRRLLLGVYVVPLLALAAVIWIVDYA